MALKLHSDNISATRHNSSLIGFKLYKIIHSQKFPSKKLKSLLEKIRHKQALDQADIKYIFKASARLKNYQ